MQIPTTLKHKPVIEVPDYENIDGKNAYDSDAKGLSLGLAQWNDRGRVDISAKVWRYTGEKWSRQSEELPLHRVLDLAMLIARAKQYVAESYREPPQSGPEIDRIGLQGDAMTLRLCADNPLLEGDLALFAEAMRADDEFLSERLRTLRRLLEYAGY